VAVTVALIAPLLAGCGSGFHAKTSEIYQPGPGISVRTGGVYAVNMLIVTDGQGNGTLIGALINQQKTADKLTAVDVVGPGGHAVTTSILSGTIALAPQKSVQLADTADVRLTGHLVAGAFYHLTLTFDQAAPITTQIPILTNTDAYSGVTVAPAPTSTTPSHSP